RHTRSKRDWSSDVCSSDLTTVLLAEGEQDGRPLRQRGVAPGGERLGGGGDRRFHGRLRTQRHLAADDAGGGVRDIAEAGVGAREIGRASRRGRGWRSEREV